MRVAMMAPALAPATLLMLFITPASSSTFMNCTRIQVNNIYCMHTTFCQLACKLQYMHLTCTLWTWERKQLGRCEIKKTCILAPMLIYFACIIYIILSLSLSLPLSHLSDGKESQQVTGVIIMFPHKLGP